MRKWIGPIAIPIVLILAFAGLAMTYAFLANGLGALLDQIPPQYSDTVGGILFIGLIATLGLKSVRQAIAEVCRQIIKSP